MPKITKAEREASIERLRDWLPDGSTVYTILRSVASSGMSRTMSVVIMRPDGATVDVSYLTFHVSRVLNWRLVEGFADAIRVQGCGMDMGFHLVECLGHAIGRNLKQRWL